MEENQSLLDLNLKTLLEGLPDYMPEYVVREIKRRCFAMDTDDAFEAYDLFEETCALVLLQEYYQETWDEYISEFN